MNFFDMGLPEILLIMIVALLIWGPEKLPGIARNLGKMTRALKKTTSDLTAEITRELNVDEKDRPSLPKANREKNTGESQDTKETGSDDTETDKPEEG